MSKAVGFRLMTANRQLAVAKGWPALLPGLLSKGLSLEDAAPLAHNVAYLYEAVEWSPPLTTPAMLLDRLTMGEIAALCEECSQRQNSQDWKNRQELTALCQEKEEVEV